MKCSSHCRREVDPALLHPALDVGRGDLVRRGERGVVGGEERHRRVLVGDAGVGQPQVERGEPAASAARSAGCTARRPCRPPRRRRTAPAGARRGRSRTLKARTPITTASRPRELLGREVRAGESRDLVAHLLEALGHAVAGAGDVADALALDRELEGDGLQPRGRLEQLHGDVLVHGSRPAGWSTSRSPTRARAVMSAVAGLDGALTVNASFARSPAAASRNGCDAGRDRPALRRLEVERACRRRRARP